MCFAYWCNEKNLLLLLNLFNLYSFLVLLAFHMSSKVKSTLVRHRLSTLAKNPNIFGKLKNLSDSILKPEREDVCRKTWMYHKPRVAIE